ncbi:MAG: hypothetical protein R6U19_02195 [Bacteroidales bacterium]
MKICILYLVTTLFFITSCDSSRDLNVDVSGESPQEIKIKRYGKAIFSLDTESLTVGDIEALHKDYPFFVRAQIDSLEVNAMREFLEDPVNSELYKAVSKKYRDITALEADLAAMFRHFNYYFSGFQVPEVYTYVSSMNHEKPVIYQDSVLVIGLDMYLGADFEYYDMVGIPKYRSRWFVAERVVPEACQAIIEQWVQSQSDPNLLDYMIRYGKIQYLLDAILPENPRKYKIRYTEQQQQWIRDNETFVWSFLVEKELLFSKDRPKIKGFLDDGPFSSMISKEAPPRLAQWFGWRIVKKYMDKNQDVRMLNLLQEKNSMKILKQSGYKPARAIR